MLEKLCDDATLAGSGVASCLFVPYTKHNPSLTTYKYAIVEHVNEAHLRVLREAGPLLKSMSSRTRQSLIRDLIFENLKGWADRTPGVQHQKKGNLEWFGFRNNWVIRVKHVDADYAVGVSPTHDSQEYNRNEMPDTVSATLVEHRPATALYLGWYVTQNSPFSPEVCLVCPNEHSEIAWVWPLSGEGPPPTLALPVPDAPQGPSIGTRVKVKTGKTDRKKSA